MKHDNTELRTTLFLHRNMLKHSNEAKPPEITKSKLTNLNKKCYNTMKRVGM